MYDNAHSYCVVIKKYTNISIELPQFLSVLHLITARCLTAKTKWWEVRIFI